MTNNFYGFRNLEEFEERVEKLRRDLYELTNQDVPSDEVLEYDIMLLKGRSNYRKGFWAYDDPNNMPADSRVAYVYTPTYLATAILMYSWMKYQKVREYTPLEGLLREALFACTGRNFSGAGSNSEEGRKDAMKIFKEAHTDEFVEKYPNFCPEFTALYEAERTRL